MRQFSECDVKTPLKIDDHESVFPNVFFSEVIDIYIHREKS